MYQGPIFKKHLLKSLDPFSVLIIQRERIKNKTKHSYVGPGPPMVAKVMEETDKPTRNQSHEFPVPEKKMDGGTDSVGTTVPSTPGRYLKDSWSRCTHHVPHTLTNIKER